MGRSRKLPAQRKHKKLKSVDPANRTAQRAAMFKQEKHANQAPADEDFQPAPRSFIDLMKRTRKLIAKKPKRSRNDASDHNYATVVESSISKTPSRSTPATSSASPSGVIDAENNAQLADVNRITPRRNTGDVDRQNLSGEPIFERRRHESKWNFLQRMNRAAQTAMTKASIESRFGVKLKNAGKGKVLAEADRDLLMEDPEHGTGPKKSKNLAALSTEKSVHVTKRKFKDVSDGEARKRSLRAEARRDYAGAKRESEMFAPEAVAFGERNDQPPNLTAKPRIKPKKPGEPVEFPVFDLSMLAATTLKPKNDSNDEEANRTKFRKLKVEQRRVTVVDQYRQLKKAKWSQLQQEQQHKPLVDDSPG